MSKIEQNNKTKKLKDQLYSCPFHNQDDIYSDQLTAIRIVLEEYEP